MFEFIESFVSNIQEQFSLDNVILIIASALLLLSLFKFVNDLPSFQKIKLCFLKKTTISELSDAEENCKPYFNYAPIDLSKELSEPSFQEQFRQLDFYLQDQKVKNLAIFGSFGSGKSSLIKTYFNSSKFGRKESSDSVIYISLPDFEYENKTSDKQKNNFCPNQQDSIHERGTEPNLTNQGSSKI